MCSKIPKTIHYCWFGKNPLPDSAQRCIDSWKKYCPDYKIVRWDESNYDVTKNKYMYDAYKEQKWAFVSDYARLDIIYQHGGIYLDTDVEILRSFDNFLNNSMFCGWEMNTESSENVVAFGLGFGAKEKNKILKDLLELYNHLNFYNEDGSLNLLPCPHYQTEILKKHGLDTNHRNFQKTDEFTVYPVDYFSPKNYITGEINITENTYSIHHYSASWFTKKEKKWNEFHHRFYEKHGIDLNKNIFGRIVAKIYKYGFIEFFRASLKRLK